MNTALSEQIDSFIRNNTDRIISDIGELVSIDSVQQAAEPGAPFGAGVRSALDKTLEIARRLGLDTLGDEVMGYAALPGTDPEKYLATICHVDVVPAGNGWDADPFTMRVQDGWLLGRGVADDKGPMVLCLYALAFLKQQGVTLRYPIRALVGTNEETGMKELGHYFEKNAAPVFCFTPDAEFPVCNGEKGQFGGLLVSPQKIGGILQNLEGGVANNAVPDRAFALVKADIENLPGTENITLSLAEEGLVRIDGQGISGHAASPEGTRNAIGVVVDYLLANALGTPEELGYLRAVQKLHSSTAGKGLGIDCKDEPFGPLTVIGGRIYLRDGHLVQTIDSRFPTTTDGETIAAAIRNAIGTDAQLECGRANEPFYISADSPAILACIDTFNQVTGRQDTPFTMGGGTYARHFPYAVSFGPEYADTVLPAFGGPMHGANEAAPLDKLLQALKIYIIALLRLEEIEL